VIHAGRGIGLGHLKRSLVAARALTREAVAQLDFVVIGEESDVVSQNAYEFPIRMMTGSTDEVIYRLTERKRYSALYLDLYHQFHSLNLVRVLTKLRRTACRIVAIDSLPNCENLIDLLYVPSCLPPIIPSANGFEGRLVFGWDSFLLDIDPRYEWGSDHPHSILVLTGGSDATGLGQVWPEILSGHLPKKTRVDWVTGPFADSPIFPSSSTNIRFVEHVAPASLNNLMHHTEIAVSVFGVSFFELIALGIPTVVFSPYGAKNERELDQIQKEGVALVASDASDAARQASVLMMKRDLQIELSKRARNLIRSFDGRCFVREIKQLLGL